LGVSLNSVSLQEKEKSAHLIKMFGMAHSGNKKCISQLTEGNNLVVLESGFNPLILNKKLNICIVEYSYDCIGSKSEIEDYIKKLRLGKIHNVNSDKVTLSPWTRPMQINNDTYWARLQIEVTYKKTTDGVFPMANQLHLECPTAVAIKNGKEYFFLQSRKNLYNFNEWSIIRESLTNPKLVAGVKVLRYLSSSKSDYGIEQFHILDLLYGAVRTIPLTFALNDYLDASYIETLINLVEIRIFKERKANTRSIVDYLLNWTSIDKQLFKELYKEEYLRPRIKNTQRSSIKNFFHEIHNKNVTLLKDKSLNTLYYHAAKIQDTLDEIHDRFVRKNSGLEVELVYRTLYAL